VGTNTILPTKKGCLTSLTNKNVGFKITNKYGGFANKRLILPTKKYKQWCSTNAPP
jgi:hypothetical protein